MKRKFSARIGTITDRLQEILSELMEEGGAEFLCIAADHIEIAIDSLEEARMALARGGH